MMIVCTELIEETGRFLRELIFGISAQDFLPTTS